MPNQFLRFNGLNVSFLLGNNAHQAKMKDHKGKGETPKSTTGNRQMAKCSQ